MTNKPMLSVELRSVLSMILNALDRDAAKGKVLRGEMAQELRAVLDKPDAVVSADNQVMPCLPMEPGLPVTAYCAAEVPDYWPCRSAEELERFEAWKIEDDKASGERS